jgi:transposase-like protein
MTSKNSSKYSTQPTERTPASPAANYTAASEAEALDRFAEFSGTWEKRYPAIIRLWENAWPEFVPFLAFDREIRAVICTTDENVNPGGLAGQAGSGGWLDRRSCLTRRGPR